MSSQLKHRLVGMIVLIFLALIILPWLFSNKRQIFQQDKLATKKQSITAKIPEKVRSQTFTTQKTLPLTVANNFKTTLLSANAQNSPKINTFPERTPMVKPTEPIVEISNDESTKISSIENKIVSNKPAIKKRRDLQLSSNQKNIILLKPHFEKIKLVANTHLKTPNKKNLLQKSWAVQLGCFSKKNNANQLIKRLTAKGYQTYVKTGLNSSGNSVTRVYVGPVSEHNMAEAMARKIGKTFNISGIVVKSKYEVID